MLRFNDIINTKRSVTGEKMYEIVNRHLNWDKHNFEFDMPLRILAMSIENKLNKNLKYFLKGYENYYFVELDLINTNLYILEEELQRISTLFSFPMRFDYLCDIFTLLNQYNTYTAVYEEYFKDNTLLNKNIFAEVIPMENDYIILPQIDFSVKVGALYGK